MMKIRNLTAGLLLAICGACASPAAAAACETLDRQANSGADASAALTDCLNKAAPGSEIALAAGVYRLNRPVVINKAISLTTAGLGREQRGCADLPAGRCATLLIDPKGAAKPKSMPVLVAADDVMLTHLVIQGSGITSERRADCRAPASRPLGGGLRVSGSRFTLKQSVLSGFACYSALEITSGASGPTIKRNKIGPNGDHSPGDIWADGVTIHDSNGAVVAGNLFVDNTDVQLILGGCRGCRVQGNRFRHTGSFKSASFAELMLQAWPSTSGNYDGTIVAQNSIDCGERRRCGYGIMVGSAPWYGGRASGGTIVNNRVANAMIAINVDALTGPVQIRNNLVRGSGGRSSSDCGTHNWPPVNVGPSSRAYVQGEVANVPSQSISTARCLLNRQAS